MPGYPLTDPNWADDTTDTVVRIVGTVRDKATKPLVYAARGLVFGIIAAFLGIFALVLTVIGLMRGIQAFADIWLPHERSVYISYFAVGVIFTIIGLLLFRKRTARAA